MLPYKMLTEFNHEYNQSLCKETIGHSLKNTSLNFLHHWSLFLILAITNEGKTLLLDFATDVHPNLHQPKNIFQSINGLVNSILKSIGNSLNTQFPRNHTHPKTRCKQILQYELTFMFVKFLLEQYKNESFQRNKTTKNYTKQKNSSMIQYR